MLETFFYTVYGMPATPQQDMWKKLVWLTSVRRSNDPAATIMTEQKQQEHQRLHSPYKPKHQWLWQRLMTRVLSRMVHSETICCRKNSEDQDIPDKTSSMVVPPPLACASMHGWLIIVLLSTLKHLSKIKGMFKSVDY